jgi:hypothetical protein
VDTRVADTVVQQTRAPNKIVLACSLQQSRSRATGEGRRNFGRGPVTLRYLVTSFNLAEGSNTNVGLSLASNGEK